MKDKKILPWLILVFILGSGTFFNFAHSLAQSEKLLMPRYSVTGGALKENSKSAEFVQTAQNLQLKDAVEKARQATWEEAKAFFDFSRALPQADPAELTYKEGVISKSTVKTAQITPLFQKLYQLNFSDPKYGLKTPTVPEENWLRSFANIVSRFRDIRGQAPQTKELLDNIKINYPQIWNEVSGVLPALVKNDFLYGTHWTPWEDESQKGKDNDGMFFLPHWQMKKNPNRASYWNEGDIEDRRVYQGGVIIFASLTDIKKTERNYKEYLKHVGMGYLQVAPVNDSYMLGKDSRGNEFVGIEVYFRQALPFPYDSTKFKMKLFDYYNEKGHYVSDYYSLDQEDLVWMAGRDTFFPLKTTAGETIGYIIATELGYDIKNLPERDKDRMVAIKGCWGNIKLITEGYGGVSKVSSAPGKAK